MSALGSAITYDYLKPWDRDCVLVLGLGYGVTTNRRMLGEHVILVHVELDSGVGEWVEPWRVRPKSAVPHGATNVVAFEVRR